MFQGKAGWWIAGACAVVILVSIGYGMGRRSAATLPNSSRTLEPAGAPLTSSIQIEPIQPQEELASISTGQTNSKSAKLASAGSVEVEAVAPTSTTQGAADPAAVSQSRTESSARVREIQLALKAAGFDPGPADGRIGMRTKTAIRDFQLANGLEADGKVGPKTWNRLESYLKQGTSTAQQKQQ